MTSERTRLVVLLGHPVAHSRSPAMMTAAFEYAGIDASYVACDVAPEQLADAVRGLLALNAVGANVTLPHKRAVLAHCDEVEPGAKAIGAANTLVRTVRGTVACNTDAAGFVGALTAAGVTVRGQHLVLIGTGGAARAAAVGAALSGAGEISIVGRDAVAARAIASAVGDLASIVAGTVDLADTEATRRVASRAGVLVQATALGMTGHPVDHEAESRINAMLEAVPPGSAAMDLVYAPRETAWLRIARNRGLHGIDGLGMLAHQGALAFARWFGTELPASVFCRFLDEMESGR